MQGKSDTWNPEQGGNRAHKSRISRQLRQSNAELAITAGKPTLVRERIVYKRKMARKSTSFRFPETNAKSTAYGCSSISSSTLPAAVSDDKRIAVRLTATDAATLIGTVHGGDVSNSHSPAVLIRAIITRQTADGARRSKIVESVRAKSVTKAGQKIVNSSSSSNAPETTMCKYTMSIEDDNSSAVATTTDKIVKSDATAATSTVTPAVTSTLDKRVTGTTTSRRTLRKKNTKKIKNSTEIIRSQTNSTESVDAAESTNLQQTTDADGTANTLKNLVTVIIRRTAGRYFRNSLTSGTTLLQLRPAASSSSPSRPVTDPTVRKNWLGKVTALFTNRSVRDKRPSVTTKDRGLLDGNAQPPLKLPGRYESEEYKMNWKSFVPIPACGGFVGTWKGRRNDRNTGNLISGADKHG